MWYTHQPVCRLFLTRRKGHRALDGLHGIIHVQPAPIEQLTLDVRLRYDLAQAQADHAQGQGAHQFPRTALGQVGREVRRGGSRLGYPLLGDAPGAGVGCEEVEGTPEHDGLDAGLGGGQQEVVGAAGGNVEPVEVAGGGRAGGRDRCEVDEDIAVGDGLLGKGGVAQVADKVVLRRGASGEGNGIHSANLVRALPVGGERLSQLPGAAGDRYTHRTSLRYCLLLQRLGDRRMVV